MLYNIAVFGEEMLNREFLRADSLFHIRVDFARMGNSCFPFTNLGTIRAHPENGEASCACFFLLELIPSVY